MVKLINVSGRKIDISKNVSILPGKDISGDIEITPRIEQLLNTGLLKRVEQLYEKKDFKNSSFVSSGDLRRQQILENIKAGNIFPSVNTEIQSNNTIQKENTTSKRGRKKTK